MQKVISYWNDKVVYFENQFRLHFFHNFNEGIELELSGRMFELQEKHWQDLQVRKLTFKVV